MHLEYIIKSPVVCGFWKINNGDYANQYLFLWMRPHESNAKEVCISAHVKEEPKYDAYNVKFIVDRKGLPWTNKKPLLDSLEDIFKNYKPRRILMPSAYILKK